MAAIDHQQTDRVPADLWAEEEVWERLLRDLGVRNRDDVLDRLNIDLRYVSPVYPPDRHLQRRQAEHVGRTMDDGQHALGHELGARQRRAGRCFEPGRDRGLSLAFLRRRRLLLVGPTVRPIRRLCDRLRQRRHLRAAGAGSRIGKLPLRYLAEPGLGRLDHARSFSTSTWKTSPRCLEATRGRIDIYWALTDLGTQAGLLQSRETFHRFIAPPIRTLAETAHSHGVKFMFHTCGAVRELIPDLIELGVDILNPIQPAAAGMAPEGLKRDFGERSCVSTAGSTSSTCCRWSPPKRSERRSGGARGNLGQGRRLHPRPLAQPATGHFHGKHPRHV